MYRIMVVDDEYAIVRALKRELNNPQYDIETFTNPVEALAFSHDLEFDLIISDFRMPQMDGVSFLTKVKHRYPWTIRLILSAHADLDNVLSAINEAQVHRFIAKPWNKHELYLTVARALEYRDVLLENQRLADELRASRDKIKRQEQALRELEHRHPELLAVNWGPDGTVILDEP